MSLIIATGSNLGDSLSYLETAREKLSQKFELIAASRIYRSAAVDYEAQPDFFNQVLEFSLPPLTPAEVLQQLMAIETAMGRVRENWRGPRTIDLDIIMWALDTIHAEHLTIPHPRWSERSFVVKPFQELPYFQTVVKWFTIPKSFKIDAFPI
jgi:2-amino-4-hydroxy-6-hydroxymethyldihydropteridine diphosphokinase